MAWIVAVGLSLSWLASAAAGAQAQGPQWFPAETLPPTVQLDSQFTKDGGGVEFTRFRVDSKADFQTVRLVHVRKPALAMDEFAIAVPLHSTQKGIRLAARLVLPNQIDPRTRKPLVTWVPGDESSGADKWQTLSLTGNKAAVQNRVRELRGELNQPLIDDSGAYFDACALVVEFHHGTTFFDIGLCEYGPVVKPDVVLPTRLQRNEGASRRSQLRIERDRLVQNGEPVFLRIMPDHNEPPQLLQRLGINAVWVSDLSDVERMRVLAEHNIFVIATPPHPDFDPADFGKPLQGLPPLEINHPQPDIWMFGTRIGVDQFPHLLSWAKEVRSADKKLRRPLMADVAGAEGVASRQIGLVGISQHSSGWLRNFGEARNRSFLRQNATAQLSLPWEWVQAEPSVGFADWRKRSGVALAFVEPEQIMMQMIASVSAGCRGVGFWKTQGLMADTPEAEETAKAIELANLYLDILEPLLIDGRLDSHIPINVSPAVGPGGRNGAVSTRGFNADSYLGSPRGPDAAIGGTPGPSLVLAGFWDDESHYVPQQLYAANAELTVAATETASAWQVFATGLRGLRREPAAGGLRLKIKDFDQHAAVLISSDINKRMQLQQRVQARAGRAAQLFVDLAELKLARTMRTCQLIDAETSSPDLPATQNFQRAREFSTRASEALGRRNLPAAEKFARQAMRETRAVQNRYWQRAIQALPTPLASPHTVSFSTLPDHWKMVNSTRAATPSENLVAAGDFNNLRLLSDGAWKKISPLHNTYFSTADIVTETVGVNQALQLQAWRRSPESRERSGKPSLMVRSPEIEAVAGDVFEVSLKVKVGQRIRSEQELPLLIFDDDLGPEFAVRPSLGPAWRTVRILRQMSQDGPFRVWIALDGVAEVLVDDVSVVRQSARSPAETPGPPETQGSVVQPVSGSSRGQGAGYSNLSFP